MGIRKHKLSLKGAFNKGGLKREAFVTTLSLVVILASCETKKESESPAPSTGNEVNSVMDEKSEIIGDFQYPENPAEQLKSALESDINERGLPMEISDVENIDFDGKESTQIVITFSDSNKNMCVISFTNKYLDYGNEESLDGRDNPSFIMAFKDQDNSQDMITVLTSVIKYLSPNLSLKEAERLATKQDETISTDGYSMPQDIGGYQVQARYTNPHVYFRVQDFEAKLGVEVTALKQIWGTVDTRLCKELITSQDYKLLTERYVEEKEQLELVYADFIVKNVWQQQSYLHGETWETVDVESTTGERYSLNVDTMRPFVYEFVVGQRYTLYIWPKYSRRIIYAIPRSELTQLNSRGELQPIDYPTDDWRNPVVRIEPDGEGIIYDVCFVLKSQPFGDRYAALEGHGIGEKQWPNDPGREGYTFAGWYDNADWNGNPYTKDTPIYQDTYLYAKWKYIGSSGVWPRAHRGDIQGVDEGSSLSVGQKLTITASGYNMNLESPKDQRFRWMPETWRLSDGTSGSFSSEAPFQASLSLNNKGEMRLYITYLEEIFDGIDWQETGQLHEVEEVMFRIG